jgi:hypothetical protein
MFSSPSYGEWTGVSETLDGHVYYVDFERIRKHGGYFYFWSLTDYFKPTKYGHLSSKVYRQGDCKLFRHKMLNSSYHQEPMGNGPGDPGSNKGEMADWQYPPPNSVTEIMLKRICSRFSQ